MTLKEAREWVSFFMFVILLLLLIYSTFRGPAEVRMRKEDIKLVVIELFGGSAVMSGVYE